MKLYAPEVWVDRIAAGWHELGDERAVLLIQLAPNHTRDDARLDYLLGALPPWIRVAVEFRHPNCVDEAVFGMLEHHGAAYCVMSGAHLPCVLRATAPFVYVRLHGPDPAPVSGSYRPADLRWWSDRLREWEAGGKDVFRVLQQRRRRQRCHNARALRLLLGR